MNKLYGYCRISHVTQNIQRQLENILAKYPTAILKQEIFTGTTSERKEWIRLKKMLKSGDTIIFDSVSRMSRNSEDGVVDYVELMENGINLIFLKEPYINTDVYKKAVDIQLSKTGNEIADIYIKATEEVLKILAKEQIIIAFNQAEKEVLDLRQRTKEGMAVARSKGSIIGRREGIKIESKKAIEMKEKIKRLSKDFEGTLKDIDLLGLLNLSRNSYYKYKKELSNNKLEKILEDL